MTSWHLQHVIDVGVKNLDTYHYAFYLRHKQNIDMYSYFYTKSMHPHTQWGDRYREAMKDNLTIICSSETNFARMSLWSARYSEAVK